MSFSSGYESLTPQERAARIVASEERLDWFIREGFLGLAKMEARHLYKLLSVTGEVAVMEVGQA